MPRKRVAFDTTTKGGMETNTVPVNTNNGANQKPPGLDKPRVVPDSYMKPPPPQRRDYTAKPRAASPAPQVSRGTAIRPPRADPIGPLKADVLAESKGKEMAIKACRAITVDATRESGTVVTAAKIVAAGQLLGDSQVVGIGKELARRVESYTQKQASALLARGTDVHMSHADHCMSLSADRKASEETRIKENTDMINSITPVAQVVSTCKAPVRVAKHAETLTAIVDTGASKSAITRDTLRRLGLPKYIEPYQSFYFNADGRKTPSLGRIRDVPVTLGRLTTKVSFSVTDAMTYDVLLGMDFLKAGGAILDLREDNIRYDLGEGLEGVLPLNCHVQVAPPEADAATLMGPHDVKLTAPKQGDWMLVMTELEEGEVSPPASPLECCTPCPSLADDDCTVSSDGFDPEDRLYQVFSAADPTDCQLTTVHPDRMGEILDAVRSMPGDQEFIQPLSDWVDGVEEIDRMTKAHGVTPGTLWDKHIQWRHGNDTATLVTDLSSDEDEERLAEPRGITANDLLVEDFEMMDGEPPVPVQQLRMEYSNLPSLSYSPTRPAYEYESEPYSPTSPLFGFEYDDDSESGARAVRDVITPEPPTPQLLGVPFVQYENPVMVGTKPVSLGMVLHHPFGVWTSEELVTAANAVYDKLSGASPADFGWDQANGLCMDLQCSEGVTVADMAELLPRMQPLLFTQPRFIRPNLVHMGISPNARFWGPELIDPDNPGCRDPRLPMYQMLLVVQKGTVYKKVWDMSQEVTAWGPTVTTMPPGACGEDKASPCIGKGENQVEKIDIAIALSEIPLRAEELPWVFSPDWIDMMHDHVIPYIRTVPLMDIPMQPEVVARGIFFTFWAMLLRCMYQVGHDMVWPSGLIGQLSRNFGLEHNQLGVITYVNMYVKHASRHLARKLLGEEICITTKSIPAIAAEYLLASKDVSAGCNEEIMWQAAQEQNMPQHTEFPIASSSDKIEMEQDRTVDTASEEAEPVINTNTAHHRLTLPLPVPKRHCAANVVSSHCALPANSSLIPTASETVDAVCMFIEANEAATAHVLPASPPAEGYYMDSPDAYDAEQPLVLLPEADVVREGDEAGGGGGSGSIDGIEWDYPSGSSCSDDSDSESDGIPALEDMTDSSSDWESEEEELEQEGAEIDPGLTVGDIDEATDRVTTGWRLPLPTFKRSGRKSRGGRYVMHSVVYPTEIYTSVCGMAKDGAKIESSQAAAAVNTAGLGAADSPMFVSDETLLGDPDVADIEQGQAELTRGFWDSADGNEYGLQQESQPSFLTQENQRDSYIQLADKYLPHEVLAAGGLDEDDGINVGCTPYHAGELPLMTECAPGSIQTTDQIKIGTDLSREQAARLQAVLRQQQDLFAFTPDQLGKCTTTTFDITLKPGAKPIAQRPYRQSPKEKEIVKKEIDKMLELGLIQPCQSSWSSPIVLVPKKDGTMRLTIDYRKLNSVTEKREMQMVNLEEVLNSLGKASWFALADANKGYLQIPCTERASKYCSFVSPNGSFSPSCMTMGLLNAPACYQDCMNQGLAEHIGVRCFVYLDDIIIYAESFEELMDNIRLVFGNIRQMGLTLAPAKCLFGVRRLTFLGHVVDADGTRPDPRLVDSVIEFPRPKSRTQVQSFLGLAGFYRRFIEHFALIASPLHDLTKQDSKFAWNDAAEEAFQTLKQKLAEWPILRRPDFSKPFIVKTDACKQGFGSILAQKDDTGREVVIGYASRKTKSPEQNYSASELECAAVVWALCSKWRCFVYLSHFYLVTDHQSLKWLMTTRNLTGRLARWSLHLQEFDFEIIYRPGKQHGDVDGLSRAVAPADFEAEEELMSQQEAGQQGSQMVYLKHGLAVCEIYHLDDEEEADCQVELNWVEVEKDAACQEEVDKGNTAGKPAGAAQGNGGQTSIPVPSYILSPDYKPLLHEDLPPVTYEGKTLTVGSSEWISTMVNVIIPDANDGTWGYGQEGSFSPHNKHGSGNYVWVRILHEVSRYGYSTTLRDGAAELAFLVRQQTDSCNRAKQYKDEQQRIAAGEPHSGRNGISISRFPDNYDDFYDPNPPPVTLAQLQAAALYWMYQAPVWAAQEVIAERKGKATITLAALKKYAWRWLVLLSDLEAEVADAGIEVVPTPSVGSRSAWDLIMQEPVAASRKGKGPSDLGEVSDKEPKEREQQIPRCISQYQPGPSSARCVRISIDGSIAAGKSSIIEALPPRLRQCNLDFDYFPEPVAEWERTGALSRFYEKSSLPQNSYERWIATRDLQATIMDSYLAAVPYEPSVIIERGMLSALSVFTPLAKLHPHLEQGLYKAALDSPDLLHAMPHGIVYIDVPAEVCLQRIRNRGVPYEQKVDLIYLTKLEERYKQMLADFKGPCKIIDGLQPRDMVLQQVAEAIKLLTSVITAADPAGNSPEILMPSLPAVGPATMAQNEEYRMGQMRDVERNTDPSVNTKRAHHVLYPGGTVLSALTNGNTCWQVGAGLPIAPQGYDPEHFALVLFQGSSGRFGYSQSFKQHYQFKHGTDPSEYDRVDPFDILEIASSLGWYLAAGPTCSFALAAVPRRGLEAMTISKGKDGAETVMIHPDTYAIRRLNQKSAYELQDMDAREWIKAFQAEGHFLNMQIQVYSKEWELHQPLITHRLQAEQTKQAGMANGEKEVQHSNRARQEPKVSDIYQKVSAQEELTEGDTAWWLDLEFTVGLEGHPLPSELETIRMFGGEGYDLITAREWVDSIDQAAERWGWDIHRRVFVARHRSTAAAYRWIYMQQTYKETRQDWGTFKEKFCEKFKQPPLTAEQYLETCLQEPSSQHSHTTAVFCLQSSW